MKLPVVAGKDTIMVIYNRLLKITHFIATTKRMLAESLTRLFKENMWKLYRLLKSIVLDRGLQFIAEMMKELNRMLGIKTKLSTLYHL